MSQYIIYSLLISTFSARDFVINLQINWWNIIICSVDNFWRHKVLHALLISNKSKKISNFKIKIVIRLTFYSINWIISPINFILLSIFIVNWQLEAREANLNRCPDKINHLLIKSDFGHRDYIRFSPSAGLLCEVYTTGKSERVGPRYNFPMSLGVSIMYLSRGWFLHQGYKLDINIS